ncbi:MAG: DoxX family protein [Bryobacterales bacterium]|nr:DoxX family protein [Bryobacterales bacterium]
MKSSVWVSRGAVGLAALFLFLDAFGKLAKVPQVIEGSSRLGFGEATLPGLGAALAISTLLYVVPRTSVLGAILLTGYLGGAVAAHVRIADPVFAVLFPVLMGALVWGGIWFREAGLRSLLPLRSR